MGILDSGERFEFETGAVRDMQEGKGRLDLVPFDIACDIMAGYDKANVFYWIKEFSYTGNYGSLLLIIDCFAQARGWDMSTLMIEVSKQFEDGCRKYGLDNWKKGLPARIYVNSALRHYLKWLRGDQDEPHDRAFVWNLIACAWTCIHKPELNDYSSDGE
jgi:hypothetical protein